VTTPVNGRPAAWPVASTRLVALLGWPTGHSLSPAMHNAAFAHDGLDLVYVAMPTRPDDLPRVVAGLAAVGAVGANVTVPHKRAVMALCDEVTAEAQLVGAVNTLVFDDDRLVGDNTDAIGLQRALEDALGERHADRAVVLGTGGAARAVAVAVARLGTGLVVVGRRSEAATAVAGVARGLGVHAEAVDLDDADSVSKAVTGADLVVNATPLGLHGESLPAPFMALGAGQAAYDLVYNPATTPFLAAGRAGGAAAHNGLGMLVAQAAAAYERWTGRPAPVEVMRGAADAAP
jgi:shikimate dehydrogenase